MSLIGRSTIGTVCYLGGVLALPEPFTKAWGDMIQYNYEYLLKPTERIQYVRSTVSYHSFARDGLIDQMQGDWILMLDTDILFDPDIVAQMLHYFELYNIDVLCGMYPYKGTVHAPVIYGYNKKTKNRYILGDWDDSFDIIECDGAGAGCLLIRRSVVDKIKAKNQSLFAIIEPFSEDNSFFIRCRRNRIKTYYTPKMRLRHLIYDELSIEKDYPKKARIVKKEQSVLGMK